MAEKVAGACGTLHFASYGYVRLVHMNNTARMGKHSLSTVGQARNPSIVHM